MLTAFGIYTSFHNFLIFLGLRDFRVFIVLQMPSIVFECVRLHASASSTYQVVRPRPRSCWGQHLSVIESPQPLKEIAE